MSGTPKQVPWRGLRSFFFLKYLSALPDRTGLSSNKYMDEYWERQGSERVLSKPDNGATNSTKYRGVVGLHIPIPALPIHSLPFFFGKSFIISNIRNSRLYRFLIGCFSLSCLIALLYSYFGTAKIGTLP